MKRVDQLAIKIFADGADKAGMLEMYRNPLIKGFTTNPTLMRKAGVGEYRSFAREVLELITDRPISFEVLADDFATMERQAMEIASWVKMNVTALMTLDQVRDISASTRWKP